MEKIEIVLLVCTYSLLILSIFLQIVCYKRNLEFKETIALSVSLLLLVISITSSSFLPISNNQLDSVNVFILISMILVGVTTPLNIFKEREHKFGNKWRKYITGLSIGLLIAVLLGYVFNKLATVQMLVIGFLGLSVVLSMLFIRITNPIKRLAHRNKIERIIAIVFLIVVPISLISEFYLSPNYQFNIGFLLPSVFIILAGSKIWDDLERLSLFKTAQEGKEQNLKNYGLTTREEEIALFLAKGMTYKQISEHLHIAIPTVKTHSSNIYRKCGVKNKNELTYLLIS